MKVKIRVTGRYLGPDMRAFTAQAGQVVDVLGGPYARSLIEDGLASPAYETIRPGEAPVGGPSEAVTPGPDEPNRDALISLPYIGPVTADRLIQAGFLNPVHLARADELDVARALGVSRSRARKMIEAAQERVGGKW